MVFVGPADRQEAAGDARIGWASTETMKIKRSSTGDVAPEACQSADAALATCAMPVYLQASVPPAETSVALSV